MMRLVLGITLTLVITPIFAQARVVSDEPYHGREPCWQEAAQRYGVSVELLKAVAEVESSNRARVVARNRNGSLDIGFMQINDWWLPTLKQYGITKQVLLDDACINLNIGAWILRQGIDRYGYNAQGIGAYGAGTDPKKDQVRTIYANKVFKALERQRNRRGGVSEFSAQRLQPPVTQNRTSTVYAATAAAATDAKQPATTQRPEAERLVWSVFDDEEY